MLNNHKFEHSLLYGPSTPFRPARDLQSAGTNPEVRLMNAGDLDTVHSRGTAPGTVVWPCTPIVETSPDGAQLESRPYAGLPMRAIDRRRNTLVVGAIGSGKTYCFGIPAIAATLASTNESLVINNLKGPTATEELKAIIKKIDPKAETIVFAPGDPSRSVACNLMAVARRHNLLQLLVRYVCGTMPRGQNDAAFWERVASKAIAAAVQYPEVSSLAALHELLSDSDLLQAFAKNKQDQALLKFCSFAESCGNGSTSSTDIEARTAPLCDSHEVRAVTSGLDEFDPHTFLESDQRVVLIVECNETQFDDARHALGLFFTLLFACAVQSAERAGGELARPVSFFLDEFAAMGQIPDFHKIANLGRSRGLSFHVFVQSIEQILSTYGATAGSVLAAMCSKVFLCSGLSTADREYASRLAGNTCTREWRETQQTDPSTGEWFVAGRSAYSSVRPLISADDLILRPHPSFGGYAYAFLVDQPPVIVHFTPSFEIPIIATAMQSARDAVPLTRNTPLPPVPAKGLIENPHAKVISSLAGWGAQPIGEARSSGSSEMPSDEQLEVVLSRVGWAETTGAARKWFQALINHNKDRKQVLFRIAKELAVRNATISEFFLAYVYSNVRYSIEAVLHYLDYTKSKRNEDEEQRRNSNSGSRESTNSEPALRFIREEADVTKRYSNDGSEASGAPLNGKRDRKSHGA